MNYPFYTDKPIKRTQPVELPISRSEEQTRPEAYLPDKGLIDAVNVALLLGKPLLLTGKPGTGKTQLAYHLAYQLGLQTLKFETKSTSQSRDLFYIYDALGRFHAAQAAQLEKGKKSDEKTSVDYITYNALGLAIIFSNELEKIKRFLPRDFDEKVKDGLGKDFVFSKPQRCVVLIDEIDKAPSDFPNDILNEVENLYFRIPELDNIKIGATKEMSPILILTSNSEKSLPEPFLRRCIYYDIPFPYPGRLTEIVEARLGSYAKSEFVKDALKLFIQLRNSLDKKPSTAELLDWIIALRRRYEDTDNPVASYPDSALNTLSALVKKSKDQEIAQQTLNALVKKSKEQEMAQQTLKNT
jgi:MoxR-like ATPase